MQKVIVNPERCVGCMQCMLACATAHSKSGTLAGAIQENPLPRPRIHVGSGRFEEGFPNRCRHCDPAPCMLACLPGAIYRDRNWDTVFIDAGRCINCASCAMACPFGVLRYYLDPWSSPGQAKAIKCDNCVHRQAEGLLPACVQACKTGALRFEDENLAQQRKTREVAQRSTGQVEQDDLTDEAPGFALLNQLKKNTVQSGLEQG